MFIETSAMKMPFWAKNNNMLLNKPVLFGRYVRLDLVKNIFEIFCSRCHSTSFNLQPADSYYYHTT